MPSVQTTSSFSAAVAKSTPQWYVMRAYKCENKAETALCGAGWRDCADASPTGAKDGLWFFIPKQQVIRVYHGVKTKRLVPAIPSLVFLHASQEDIVRFKKQHNFLQFVMRRRTYSQKLERSHPLQTRGGNINPGANPKAGLFAGRFAEGSPKTIGTSATGASSPTDGKSKTNLAIPESDYLIVPERQMDDFIRMVSQREQEVTYYTPDEINMEKGARVRIHGGNFDGVEGVFMRVQGKRNRRLVIKIEGIIAVSVEVNPDLVEVI